MLNVAAIMGRLTADPELRTTQSGTAVTSFTLAVDRSYARQGEERQTDFINVVAWRGTAEFICRYFTKGQMMAVTGSIQTRNYEDRQGNKRTAFEIVASDVSFTGSRREQGGAPAGNGGYDNAYNNNSAPAQRPPLNEPPAAYTSGSDEDFNVLLDNDDDLPF